MRFIKLALVGAFVATLSVPFLFGSKVYAQPEPNVQCLRVVTEGSISTSRNCDLELKKEVSVNGSAFADANDSSNAVQGAVGNSVVWKISVTNPMVPDDGYFVTGDFRIADVLPAGVSYLSSVASSGSYSNVTNTWEFTLGESTTYPVTLVINTTASAVGAHENIASFDEYNCDGWCQFGDFNPENNTDNAWVNISAAPVVLGESTPVVLAATDSGVAQSLAAAGLIAVTLGTLGYSRLARKEN